MKIKHIKLMALVVSYAMILMCLACLDGLDLTPIITPEETTTTTPEPEPDPLPAGEGLAVGATAPDFTLPDGDGTNYSLSDYAGQILVIQFFSTTS